MPFDYNSFLQGIQTGLRLGRTSPGRRPPVPSGRYILTESGEKIITETLATSEATLYQMGQWYSYPEGYTYQGEPLYGYFRIFPPSGIPSSPTFFLYAQLASISDPVYVIWKYQDHAGFQRMTDQYTSDPDGGSIVDISNLQGTWGIYYVGTELTYQLGRISEQTLIPVPDGTQMFEGSRSDLEQFLLNLNAQPLITE